MTIPRSVSQVLPAQYRSHRSTRPIALLLALAVFAASCGVSRESSQPAATITFADGSSQVFGQNELSTLADGLRGSERFLELAQMPEENIDSIALTQLIQTAVIEKTLEDAGGSVSTAEVAEVRSTLEAELVSIFSQQGDPDPETTGREVAEEIGAYIDSLSLSIGASEALPGVLGDSVEAPLNPCVSHILVEEEALADDLLEQLQDGADFAELAMANSTDLGSGSLGGELGCTSVEQWVPEFRDAVLAAEEGVVTEPVQSDFGFHLILVTGYEADTTGAANAAAGAALQEALASAMVEVDATIGTWDAPSNQVVPPTAP